MRSVPPGRWHWPARFRPPALPPRWPAHTATVVFEGGAARNVTINALGTDPVKGSWSFGGRSNDRISGPVTCLLVEGDEAFMFGPWTVGGRGAFLWVRDGATPGGADDEAITWIQDLPTDPPRPASSPGPWRRWEGWCLNAGEGFPGPEDPGTVPLISGNLTIQ